MNSKVKEKWLTALRDGSYRQQQGWLRRQLENEDPRFCCLGVLTDLYMKEHPDCEWEKQHTNSCVSTPVLDSVTCSVTSLSNPVLNWAGLGDNVDHDSTILKLITFNDNLNKDFQDIADVIESDL